MLIFDEKTGDAKLPEKAQARKPTAPVWSRRPESFSGEQLIDEARIRADFSKTKDPLTAKWLLSLADELDRVINENLRLHTQLKRAKAEATTPWGSSDGSNRERYLKIKVQALERELKNVRDQLWQAQYSGDDVVEIG